MSIATEIARLQTARNTLRAKAVALGIGLSTDKLDDIADAFDGIVNRGSVSATVQEGDTYTIPAGYHDGSGTVSGGSGGDDHIVWGTISIDEVGVKTLSMTWQEIMDALQSGKLVKFAYISVYAEDSYATCSEYHVYSLYVDTEQYAGPLYVVEGDNTFYADSATGEMTDENPYSTPLV